jgi:hypothetical protein
MAVSNASPGLSSAWRLAAAATRHSLSSWARWHLVSCLYVLQVRKPTNVVSTICDDRGEEPTYAGTAGKPPPEICIDAASTVCWC